MKKLFCLMLTVVLMIGALCVATSAAVVLDFADENEVANWTTTNKSTLDYPDSNFPQKLDEDGTTYMHIEYIADGVARHERALDADSVIDLDTNKFMVIRYRRSSNVNNYFYLSTEYLTANPAEQYAWYEGMIFLPSLKSNAKWDTVVYNMPQYYSGYNTDLKGEDESSESPNVKGPFEWKSNLTKIMVQPNSMKKNDYIDYEMIAFADTEENAYGVIADKAAVMIDRDFVLDNDLSGNATELKAAVSERVKAVAARYGMTASDIEVTDVTAATVTVNGAVTFDYTLSIGSYSYDMSGTAAIRADAVEISAAEANLLIGETVTVSSTVSEGVTPTEYAWYKNVAPSTVGATKLAETGSSLSDKNAVKGSYYYYLVITTATGTVTSNFLKVTVTAPAEPIIWRFNNAEMVKLWKDAGRRFGDTSVEYILTDDGTMKVPSSASDNAKVNDIYYRNSNDMGEIYKFSLDAYPYFKVKFKQAGTSKLQFYFFTDNGNNYLEQSASSDTWKTVSFNAKTNSLSGGKWGGKLDCFAFWNWHNNDNTGYTEIEYIAFFPDTAEGKAAWEAFDTDDKGNPGTTAGTSEAFLPYYSKVNSIFNAAQTALNSDTAKVETAEAAKAVLTPAVEAAIKASGLKATYTVGTVYTVSNGFKFDVTITYGEKAETTSVVKQQLTVKNNEPQPIIWRFNSQEMVDLWNNKQFNTTNKSTFANGLMHTAAVTNDGNKMDDIYYRCKLNDAKIPEAYRFNLEDYPYIKAKLKYTGDTNPKIQIYFNENSQYIEVAGKGKDVFNTYSWDFSSTGTSTMTNGTYSGELTRFCFWLRYAAADATVDYEYIAFFPNTAKGKAAWEAFDTDSNGNPGTVACSSDEYLNNHNEVKTVMANVKTAYNDVKNTKLCGKSAVKTKLEAIVAKAITDAGLKASDVNVVYGKPTIGKNTVSYDLTVYMGTVEHRSILTEKLTFKAQTEPVIWSFENPEFISRWGGGATLSFKSGILTAAMNTANDNCNIVYRIPEGERFELSEYPFVAIRYKSTHSGRLQFYPATNTSTNAEATASLYYQFEMPTNTGEWNTWVIDVLNSCSAKNNTAGTWSGEAHYMRVDFMRPHEEIKSADVEYIGFFATKAEAEAYALAGDGSDELNTAAKNAVDWAKFNEIHEGINDSTKAKAKIEQLLAATDIPDGVRTYVEITGTSTPNATVADGKFASFDYTIYFINGPVSNASILTVDGNLSVTPYVEFSALGTQYRSDGDKGIRFGTKLSKSVWGDVDVTNISFGTVVIPEQLLGDAELTLETPNAADVKAENIYKETDDELFYTAVITNIPEAYRDVRLTARAYVKYTFNSKNYTVYSDVVKTASLSAVEGLMTEGYDNEPALAGDLVYDSETWLKPFWNGDTVYHELFWPVSDKSVKGNGATYVNAETVVNLMYPISDVLIVKNGTHTQDFVEGKDYYVNDKGQLVIPADSAIKVTAYDYYISDNNDDDLHGMYVSTSTDPTENGKNLFFIEGTYIQQNFQYSITYRHNTEWPETVLNPDEDRNASAFPKTRAKLNAGEAFTIGYFGDSITAGGNNTGNYGTAPYTPKWSQMVNARLEELYNYADDVKINLVNKAVGGRNTDWGVSGDGNVKPNEFAKSEFEGTNPTLFVLAFGMNDEATGTVRFKSNIINIINQIHEIAPECEFLLVSNSMPNPLWGSTANRTQYEGILEEVVTELTAEGYTIDCAKLQSMHKYLLTRKAYRDMSGNNVNHQNDMLARLYAQTVLSYITDKN